MAKMEDQLLPHLDAAYNLARWLMKNEADARDAVQEAFIRAFKYFGTWKGEPGSGDAKPWLLKIVRNTCYTALQKSQDRQDTTEYDDDLHGELEPGSESEHAKDPESLLFQKQDQAFLREALERLPAVFREVLILSELEELPYKEIAEVLDIPVGTVMSRLSRARTKLKLEVSK